MEKEDKMKKFLVFLCAISLVFGLAGAAGAVTMMIGDQDGFGFSPTTGLVSAQGGAADVDGDGIIEPGEFLPSLNGIGTVATGSGDDFDHRSSAESSSTIGAQWTDVALSTSFAGRPGLAKDAYFDFYFTVPDSSAPDYGVDHFINFVFGDYDVVPMTADVEGTTLNFTVQAGTEDGLVKFAYAPVSWSDMLDGIVQIDINAPNEPYVAFDYALLDLEPIGPQPVPEPATMLLIGSGLLGLAWFRRFRKR
jgi:hypothetical protein